MASLGPGLWKPHVCGRQRAVGEKHQLSDGEIACAESWVFLDSMSQVIFLGFLFEQLNPPLGCTCR